MTYRWVDFLAEEIRRLRLELVRAQAEVARQRARAELWRRRALDRRR